jgi:hypothetical protein
MAVAAAVFELVGEVTGFGRTVEVSVLARDGERVARGAVLATVTGPTRLLLTAERTALNLLCRMSGVATHTRRWADALADTKATVLDTRKTTPGLRELEKYAVRVGGGTNKRMGRTSRAGNSLRRAAVRRHAPQCGSAGRVHRARVRAGGHRRFRERDHPRAAGTPRAES